MRRSNRQTDAKTHETAVAIARRCVGIIENLLRQEERKEAFREIFEAAMAELDKQPTMPEM